jgi:hypothetical protein
MTAGPVSRLARGLFIVLMSSGGGELPALDALLFHGGRSVAVTERTHFETSAGCHADQCAIRATAHHPPVTPTVVVSALELSEPPAIVPSSNPARPLSAFPILQPFSRAPPGLQI